MLSTMHPVLRYTVFATPACVLVFLLLSSFFTAWDGRAVSRRPARSDSAPITAVLIVTDDGSTTEVPWPPELAESLQLPERSTLVAPREIPDTAPHTTKLPFTLSFVVLPKGGEALTRPTTTPGALGIPLLMFFAGLLLHNISVSGRPWSWEPRPVDPAAAPPLPPAAASSQAPPPSNAPPAPGEPGRRSTYGPPPSRRSRRR